MGAGMGCPLGPQPTKPESEAEVLFECREKFVIAENNGKLCDFYDIDTSALGAGGFGTVKKAVEKSTGRERAIKIVPKSDLKDIQCFRQEISIMKAVDHPFIVKLYETFEDDDHIYLVLELCIGGDLFGRVETGKVTEKQAALVMMQAFSAVNYMHHMNVCHRDIKLENFVLSSDAPIERNVSKLIDFGIACHFKPGVTMRSKMGTADYVAPEVLKGNYDKACDLWSLGVVLYGLLSGRLPFASHTEDETIAKVEKGTYTFHGESWKGVSKDAKHLVSQLLQRNPKRRITAAQALEHVWIKSNTRRSTTELVGSKLVQNLKEYSTQNKLQKAALHVIASQCEGPQTDEIRDLFMACDANKDGVLTCKELKAGLRKNGWQGDIAELEQIVAGMDIDGSGEIDYTELVAAALDKEHYLKEGVCRSAFRVFDANGDDKICKQEIRRSLRASTSNLSQIMSQCDSNGDGNIDFSEFVHMLSGEKSPVLLGRVHQQSTLQAKHSRSFLV